jgi:DNA recombination protein RmuC
VIAEWLIISGATLVATLVVLGIPLTVGLLKRGQRLALSEQKAGELQNTVAELRQQIQQREEQLEQFRQRAHQFESQAANLTTQLEMERQNHRERLSAYEQAESRLKDVFKSISVDALRTNHQGLMQVAENLMSKYETRVSERFQNKEDAVAGLVKPVYQSLEKFDQRVQELEKQRVGAYEQVTQQVKHLADLQQRLQAETSNLASALRSPTARGKWGELQLRRVAEIAGMLSHCDFYEQRDGDKKSQTIRPDMVVKLPGNRSIIIDAKAPLQAYLEAMETADHEHRLELFRKHAAQVRKQIQNLSQKAYWQQFEHSPEFVLLFLPGESYFSAALQVDPELIEVGAQQQVILATPTTLIAMLRTAAYAWRQEAMAENAKLVAGLGQELYRRLADLSGHFQDLGKSLDKAVGSYNKAVGTLESRVFVSARRFEDLEADDPQKEIKAMPPVERQPRELQRDLTTS